MSFRERGIAAQRILDVLTDPRHNVVGRHGLRDIKDEQVVAEPAMRESEAGIQGDHLFVELRRACEAFRR